MSNMIKLEPEELHEFEYAEFINYDCPSPDPNSADEEETFEIDEDEISDYTQPATPKLETRDLSVLLTEDEERIVTSCTDPELKELILLNRKKNIQLLETFEMFNNMIIESELAVTEEKELVKKVQKMKKKQNPKLWRLGYPYFKSQDDFPCPRNADIVKKEARGELFFYGLTPSIKWRRHDMTRLIKGVAFWHKNTKISELERQIKQLKEKKKKTEEDVIKLLELKNRLVDLEASDEDSYPELGNEKCLDWSRIAMHIFDDKFSAEDCEYFWKNYLHPIINKEAWTDEENEKLKYVVSANNYQNWDLIAQQLGGNRTGFMACLHFYSKVKPHRIQGPFTAKEDKLILDLIDKYKEGNSIPWEKIVHYFPKRHRTQLYYHYNYFLKENHRLKDKFTDAEDILLLILVDRWGRKFSKMKEHFPQRSIVQLKGRYVSQLCEAKKKGAFTLEEDKKILSLVKKNGTNSWAYMEKLFHRNSSTLRQRYATLTDFLKTNPGKCLEDAPRRVFFYSNCDAKYTYLRLIADKFKIYKKIPTVEEIEALMGGKLPVTSTSQISLPYQVHPQRRNGENGFCATFFPSLTIDDLLKDYFSNSEIIEVDDKVIESAASSIQTIFTTLQAQLHIPVNYRSDSRLDSIDLRILEKITKKLSVVNGRYVVKRMSGGVRNFIPPSTSTVAALQFMLEQNQMFQINDEEWLENHNEKQLKWCISKYMSNQDPTVQLQLNFERDLFTDRFKSLFKIPAILSRISPHELLLRGAQKPPLRTYQRKFKPTPSPTQATDWNPTPSTSRVQSPIPFESVFVKEGTKIIEVIEPGEDPLTKLTVVEELKQKIINTIEDLSRNPSNKKFFEHVTKFTKNQYEPLTYRYDDNWAERYLETGSTLSTISGQPPSKKQKKVCKSFEDLHS